VDTSTNEAGFEIEKKSGAGPFTLLATTLANVISYQDTSFGPNTTYTYRVRAVNSDGTSAWTNEASVTTGATIPPPTPPNNLMVTVVSTTQTALSWTDRSGNESLFEVERRIVPGSFQTAVSLPADTDDWNDTTLGPDTSLVYRVRAVGVTSPSAWSNEVQALTPPTLGFSGVKGSLTDSATAAKDRAKAKGIYDFLPATKDGNIDPVVQGVTIHLGGEQDPAVVAIPPSDPAWVVKGTRRIWKTPKDSSVKVSVSFDTTRHTFSVSLSRITFPGPVANPVRLSIRVGNDAGSVREEWASRKPGVFKYKQP
jgi:hypothetical protein